MTSDSYPSSQPLRHQGRAPLRQKRLLRQNRLLHRWIAIVIALPMLLVILTGIVLQVRKPIDWVQPPTLTGSSAYEPTVRLEELLTQVKSVPEMQVTGWQDIKLLDMRPQKGIVKVRNFDELETQVDVTTGEVLQTAQRRNDFIAKMHDFSAWRARLWLGLPIRLGFLFMFLTGVYLNVKLTAVRLKGLFRRNPLPPMGRGESPSRHGAVDDRGAIASERIAPEKKGRPWRLRLKASLMTYHYWLGWVVLIPWAVVIGSGLLLQVRYELPWVLPAQQQGQGTVPQVEFVQLYETARQQPEYGVQDWKDVWRIYVYPSDGISAVRAKNRQEFQIDSETGEILQTAVRRKDWLEDIHEGKWHDLNLWLFLPVHILSLLLWMTGAVVAYTR